MKKVLLLVFIIVTVLTAWSCGSGGDDVTLPGDAVYSKGNSPIVVYDPDEVSDESITAVVDRLADITGMAPTLRNHTSEAAEHEIVIGKTSRSISERAYSLLERVETSGYDSAKYLIYSDGDSVAIVYESEFFSDKHAEKDVVAYFLDNYCVNDSLVMEKGVAYNTTYSIILRQEEADAIEIEKYWTDAEKTLAELYGANRSCEITEEPWYRRIQSD